MRYFRIICMCALLIRGVGYSQQGVSPHERALRGMDSTLARHGYTPKLLAKLQDGGIDLREELLNRTKPVESISVFLCDAVVVGVVKSIVDVPAPKNYPFHSKVVIGVTKVLKGVPMETNSLEILRQTGPVSGVKELYLHTSLEPKVYVGEEAIFFLNRIGNAEILQNLFKKFFRENPARYSEDSFWLERDGILSITNGQINDGLLNSHRSIGEAIQNIQNSLKLLEK